AGVVALMRQANPGLSPSQGKSILQQTAVHFGTSGTNVDFGAGRLDAYAALARGGGRGGPPPAGPAHPYFSGSLRGSDQCQTYPLAIQDPAFPIAATLILQTRNTDFDLLLVDPAGNIVTDSRSETRQEIVGFSPNRAATWTLVVCSAFGAGSYALDVSAGTSPLSGLAANRLTLFRPST